MQTLSKKAQTWGLDALVATVIFSIAMLLFFFYTVNFNDEEEIRSILYSRKQILSLELFYPRDLQ